MRVFKSIEIWGWFSVNVLLPMGAPFCIACAMNILKDVGGAEEMLGMLWNGGAYIFLSLYVLISVIPHFFERIKFNKIVLTFHLLVTAIVLLLTSLLYFNHLELLSEKKDNSIISLIVIITGILMSFITKWTILYNKMNNNEQIRDKSNERNNKIVSDENNSVEN